MSRRKALPAEPVAVRVESLAQDGRGVAHLAGKAVFIHGALPGERVLFLYERQSRRYDEGRVQQILEASPERVIPRCPHFGVCGGCGLQHQAAGRQIADKQQVVADALERLGGVTPGRWLPPLVAGHWGYRRKARLGAKYVEKKGRVLVGFRERNSSFITDLQRCEVLHPQLGGCLPELKALIESLAIRTRVPQVELSMGEQAAALIFRVLQAPETADRERLRQFGTRHGFVIYLQPGGADSVQPLEAAAELCYSLPDPELRLCFAPQDFTQVNLELNRLMVARALELLDPEPGEQVLDLFCGIGNFALPLATRAGRVTGVEADPGLVARARANAAANHLERVRFEVADLYQSPEGQSWTRERYQAALLDPPRSGAQEVLPWLLRLGVERLLYISCYPATLARDAGLLVRELGYRLDCAGVMDMFPHTTHVESVALFRRG
jgi:23S rRNA (uracil1939-C5)-methyltransferase